MGWLAFCVYDGRSWLARVLEWVGRDGELGYSSLYSKLHMLASGLLGNQMIKLSRFKIMTSFGLLNVQDCLYKARFIHWPRSLSFLRFLLAG